jgi:hypothetical protein
MNRICIFCGRSFKPYPTVPNQQYCSRPQCQKARRRKWQKEKLATDEAYRANQADCQRAWRQRNPDYWRRYRKMHPAYTERNRQLQQQRNHRKRQSSGVDRSVIAKMDELTRRNDCLSGHYRLVPIGRSGVAKMDELVVKIDVITGSCAMGP